MKKTLFMKICGIGLALSLMPVSAFAYTDYEETKETRLLSSLGIMDGYEDGSFASEGKLTRSEMVKILVKIGALGESAENMTAKINSGEMPPELQSPENTFKYTDVDFNNWAYGYWYYAHDLGFVNGYGDGTLHPDDNVTYAQLLKMIVSLLGYTDFAEDRGEYPQGFVKQASSLDITKGMDFEADTFVLRKDAAKIIANALEVPLRIVTDIKAEWNGDVKYIYEICDGKYGHQWLSPLENMGFAKATATVNTIGGGKMILRITNTKRFFDGKRYKDNESTTITVPAVIPNLKINDKLGTVIIEETEDGGIVKYADIDHFTQEYPIASQN